MPITAFSKQWGRELDVEQWLRRHGYAAQGDAELAGVPNTLRALASTDIECSCCGAAGAILVGSGRRRATGRAVTQNHFRFRGQDGSNPHDPLCDYFDEKKVSGGDYLTNFASDRSPLTRAIRELVCRGIQGGLFSQRDMRRMRQWFLDIKSRHAFTMDVSTDLLQWCVDMWSARAYRPVGQFPFRPEHGSLPGFDWQAAAAQEWARRNAHLVELSGRQRVYFHRRSIERPLKIVAQRAGEAIFDPTAIQSQYEAATTLARFAAGYLFDAGPSAVPSALQKHPTEWGATGHALLALSALLLFLRDWSLEAGVALFVRLRTMPPAVDDLEGNLIGLNPFHDFEGWQLIRAARLIGAQRSDQRPVPEQVADVLKDIHAQHADWAAMQLAPDSAQTE